MADEPPAAPGTGSDEHDALYRAAKKKAEEIQGFYIHLIVYAVVNAGLFAINALSRGEGGAWWFIWPLAAWGIGLLVHAATMLRVFSPEWAERRAREAVARARQG
ncbi:MAG TPA: 2TM domain-containing protein [Actinomycetota bacterium]|nr:2TM domain-containing protein [Actinomycetota bacterium]